MLKKRKREGMEKIKRVKSLLAIRGNKYKSIKKGIKGVFLTSREGI